MELLPYKPLYEDVEGFKRALQTNEAPPQMVVFLGQEHQLYEDLIHIYKNTIEAFKPPLDTLYLNGLEADAQELHAELFTVPLFSSSRLVVLKHAETLFKKIQSDVIVKEHFEKDIKKLPLSTFIFIQLDSNLLPQGLLYFKDIGILIKPKTLWGNNILNYFTQKASSLNFILSTDAINMLMKKCAWNFPNAVKTFDQLLLYCQKEKKITVEAVEEVCDDLENNLFFDVIDHISERKITKSIEKLNHHRYNDGIQFLAGFSKLFSDAYRFKSYSLMGSSSSIIYEKLGIRDGHPYIVKKNKQRIKNVLENYSETSFLRIFKRLVELDEQLKTESKEKGKTLLVMFVAFLDDC